MECLTFLPAAAKMKAAIRKSRDFLLMLYVWGEQWVSRLHRGPTALTPFCLTPAHPGWVGLKGTPAACFKALVRSQLEFPSSICFILVTCKAVNGAIGLVSGQCVNLFSQNDSTYKDLNLFVDCFNFLHVNCFNISIFHLTDTIFCLFLYIHSIQVSLKILFC